MTLRVKLEIVPHGRETEAYEIGRLDIMNDGHAEGASPDLCKYSVINLSKGDVGLYNGTVAHYRNDGAWECVRAVLSQLYILGPK